ncbi:hypothetical protein FG386_000762 [Cryptosporidium ryanae]|uniref:uncharacterized protein n=1 Tax=Cryptosporidium ryanae TaxID=515981 RepID=UPI003519E0A9|nr:hypothetical protein FG386_000762 [Cryptosporidium ryanae]
MISSKIKVVVIYFLVITFCSKIRGEHILLIDVYKLNSDVFVSSVFNSSEPGHYTTYISDPLGRKPYRTKEPIDKPELIDSNTVKIFGETVQVSDYEPAGVQKCVTPIFNINTCQKICISGKGRSSMAVFNLYSIVFNSGKEHMLLNVTNSDKLLIDNEPIVYGLTSCSISTLETVIWGFLTFATIFSILVFALFVFEIIEYLRFKSDMKDPLIIGGEIRTISSGDFSPDTTSTI